MLLNVTVCTIWQWGYQNRKGRDRSRQYYLSNGRSGRCKSEWARTMWMWTEILTENN